MIVRACAGGAAVRDAELAPRSHEYRADGQLRYQVHQHSVARALRDKLARLPRSVYRTVRFGQI